MEIPDVLALELQDSLARCFDAGLETEIIITKAPGTMPGGRLRVVRLRQVSHKKVILTVAGE